MPLTIRESTETGSAVLIPQCWTVRSVKGVRVGTGGLSVCMGVVIHSPRHAMGCLAHIEAIRDLGDYAQKFDQFVTYMISKIAKYGGTDPGLQAALFGNSGGASDQAFTAELRRILIARGVPGAEITDQRNISPSDVNHDCGSNPRIGGRFGTIAYAPTTGVVDCYNQMLSPGSSSERKGIRKKKLQ